jgi:uncharacterized protein DUF1116
VTLEQDATTPVLPAELERRRREANAEALDRLTRAEPVLVGVAPAGDVVPGMTPSTILTSGAPLEWSEYTGGQRRAVLHAAVHEGLAGSIGDAERAIEAGRIRVSTTQEHACIGSVAGIYTASMPVLVVRDETHGNTAYCNLYEGESRHRLNYGSYNDEVVRGLRWLERTMGPLLAEALHRAGPVRLKPLMARALRLGDELHSRNTAATLLFTRELLPVLLDLDKTEHSGAVREVVDFLGRNEYAFLRMGMAAAKATADAAHGIPYSSVLTGMALNSREFAVRVSGLGDEWFRGEHPRLEGRFFDGFSAADAEWIGGESCVTETVGLGGFAQACAPTLQAYQGGTTEAMRAIDLFAVLESGITPVIDGGLAGRDGGQIGAGVLRPGLDCFADAADAYRRHYAD